MLIVAGLDPSVESRRLSGGQQSAGGPARGHLMDCGFGQPAALAGFLETRPHMSATSAQAVKYRRLVTAPVEAFLPGSDTSPKNVKKLTETRFMKLNEVNKCTVDMDINTPCHRVTSGPRFFIVSFELFEELFFHRCVSDVQEVCLFTSASFMETNIPHLIFCNVSGSLW